MPQDPSPAPDGARPPLFELHDAVVVRAGRPILSVGEFVLQQGENLALLGPNGSGKSTFVRLITREMMPLYRDEPPVRFKGNARATLVEVRRCLGIVSSTMQDQIRVHLPVGDIVAGGLFGTVGVPLRADGAAVERARTAGAEALEMLGVGELASRDVMTLSTGQARRVLIARALVSDPEVLLFDEPCTGLDPEGMYYVRRSMRVLARSGKGIVLVTHYPEDVIPEIGRVVLLKEGEVFADGAKDELMNDATMSSLFDVPLHVRRSLAAGATAAADATAADAEASAEAAPDGALRAGVREEYFSLEGAY